MHRHVRAAANEHMVVAHPFATEICRLPTTLLHTHSRALAGTYHGRRFITVRMVAGQDDLVVAEARTGPVDVGWTAVAVPAPAVEVLVLHGMDHLGAWRRQILTSQCGPHVVPVGGAWARVCGKCTAGNTHDACDVPVAAVHHARIHGAPDGGGEQWRVHKRFDANTTLPLRRLWMHGQRLTHTIAHRMSDIMQFQWSGP